MAGPVGSEYPGTPIALSFLCLLVTLLLRSRSYANSRRRGISGPQDRITNMAVAAMVALNVLVILWAIWTHR